MTQALGILVRIVLIWGCIIWGLAWAVTAGAPSHPARYPIRGMAALDRAATVGLHTEVTDRRRPHGVR